MSSGTEHRRAWSNTLTEICAPPKSRPIENVRRSAILPSSVEIDDDVCGSMTHARPCVGSSALARQHTDNPGIWRQPLGERRQGAGRHLWAVFEQRGALSLDVAKYDF